MRPTTFKVDSTVYWTIRTYTDAGVLVDADSTPSVAVRKNGASVADSVTITKRAATTGTYDCSYNPAGEAEGDCFTIEETATLSAQAYENSWSIEAQAAERGTDNASTFDASSDQVTTDTASRDASKATGFATTADLDGLATESTAGQLEQNQQGLMSILTGTIIPNQSAISSRVVSIEQVTDKVDTMVQVDGSNWQYTVDSLALAPTGSGGGSGDSAATIYSYFTSSGREDAFKADVSGLSTFDASTDQVVASNMRGTDGANTIAPVDVSANVALILADTNELQANQGDWATATGFATPADVAAAQGVITSAIGSLNDFDPANDVVARVTLVDTTTDLTNGGGGGGGGDATAANQTTIIDAIAALNDFDPANDVVAHVTLVDTTTDLTNQTAGGIGMFQASVRVQDSSGNALQGARVNVDGTTLSLTTGVSGEVVFNLDSGVYLLNVLPPANYDTPAGQVLTITSSDPSQTVFTLAETTPPSGCDVPWIG